MFEQQIAKRRQEIFAEDDKLAIEEMRQILKEYTEDKATENEEQM